MGYSDLWMCNSDGSNCSQFDCHARNVGNCALVSERPLHFL
jgi:hypothetical protein